MSTRTLDSAVKEALKAAIESPCLKNARILAETLNQKGFGKKVFGRANQKSSIEAASESDRGIAERLANAYDASLTAARLVLGLESDRSLSVRNSAQRFFCPMVEKCEWKPQDDQMSFDKPVIEFWPEGDEEKNQFRKYNPRGGLATVLVQDFSLGISREDMPNTILALNSDSKLRAFEAIGTFGHGGSSALSFCESCLIVTRPRFKDVENEFFWTLIITEKEEEESKQSLIRRWYCEDDGLPLIGSTEEFPELATTLPGTSVWHYGYNRGGWINRIAGSTQENPWGRLGRLFFSYPLPFQIQGIFARADAASSQRNIKGSYFRLLDQSENPDAIEYCSPEKSEDLIVEEQLYGEFRMFVFVLRDRKGVRHYVEPKHPVILTLNGQNHGELGRKIINYANLPELSSSTIIEVRLDGLEEEALNEIISNSREFPKETPFTRALSERIVELLKADDALTEIEQKRQEEKAKKTNAVLNEKIAKFLSEISSDALGQSTTKEPGEGLGDEPKPPKPPRPPAPEIPANDPPVLLEFFHDATCYVAEGTTVLVKFRSDARPPKYSFHGDNPRCFTRLEIESKFTDRLTIAGKGDINARGYGSISLNCMEDSSSPIEEKLEIGQLVLVIQCTDGRNLEARLPVGLRPKPKTRKRKRKPEIKTEILFAAPEQENFSDLGHLIAEDKILPIRDCINLEKYCEVLEVSPKDCTYWGEKAEREGISILRVEINVGNPQLKKLLQSCRTSEERIKLKELYIKDIVLDCYQHCFHIDDIPEAVFKQILSEPDEGKHAAEIHLNHDKSLRLAFHAVKNVR